MTIDDWYELDEIDFSEYRIYVYNPNSDSKESSSSTQTGRSSPIPPTTTSSCTKPRDVVAEFKRGIKRDIGAFLPLKEDKGWDAWDRNTIAQARAQDVSEVLDSLYIVKTDEEKGLFDEKQKYMFAVFEKNLLTDQGKAIVRDHAYRYDARQVYIELKTYSLESTKASLKSARLLEYIVGTSIDDGTWKGTAEGFILHWLEQIRKYENATFRVEHLHDNVKRLHLQRAVSGIDELRQVKNQADQTKTITGKELKFRQYCKLLQSAAAQYGARFKPKRHDTNCPARRSVYSHDFSPVNDFDKDDDIFFDIDSDITTLQAYRSNVNPKRVVAFPATNGIVFHRNQKNKFGTNFHKRPKQLF